MGGKPAPTVSGAITALERSKAKLREVYAAFIRIGHPEAVKAAECAEEALDIVNAAAAHAAKVPPQTTRAQGKRPRWPRGTHVRIQDRYALLYECGSVLKVVTDDGGAQVVCANESDDDTESVSIPRAHLKEER